MPQFVNSNVSGDLNEVPGIGPAAVTKLVEIPEGSITNTYMLFGKYLSFKGPDYVNDEGEQVTVDCQLHNDRFWYWLKSVGITAHRSAIVKAMAEKVSDSELPVSFETLSHAASSHGIVLSSFVLQSAQFFPGIYDPRIYDSDDEDE